MDIKAFAFDLDGTLVDSVPDLARTANTARADLGLPALAQATVASYVGDGISSLVARTLADSHAAEYTGTALQQEAMTLFDRHYKQGLSISTTFYPQVQSTLARLHERGFPLALVTNKAERYTVPLLRELGISEHFEVVVSGDTLAEKKPSGLPLLHVVQTLNITSAELLMVGDSKNDILAAQAAGCPVVAVSYGYGEMADDLGADRVIQQFADLLEFVD